MFSYGKLEEEPAYFELSPKQQKHLDIMQLKNDYLRQEYHALQELVWGSDRPTFLGGMPPRCVCVCVRMCVCVCVCVCLCLCACVVLEKKLHVHFVKYADYLLLCHVYYSRVINPLKGYVCL